ncbi:VOC family protein [Dellaglioa sp. P0083]|uniref:VOC family protein n=1 Tax=Dellaglioa kimchii TaxID=3344667 RepID=UPI0038D3AC10
MKIEHVGLWVGNLETMRDFYVTNFKATFGARYDNVTKGFSSYFLSFPDGQTRLEIMTRTDITDCYPDGFGYAHLAFSVENHATVDQMVIDFKKSGIEVVSGPRTTGDGYYEAVILDPEGNQIELVG